MSFDSTTGELQPSMGGLATALASVKPPPSHWVGALDGDGEGLHQGSTDYHPLGMSDPETAGHYAGISNGMMWPLYHGLGEFVPSLQDVQFWTSAAGKWWAQYGDVNQRFAAKLVQHAPSNSLVWVHDYQLQLVPAMLQSDRPDLTIGFFLHIPFPSYKHYARIPHHKELLTGLLANDVLGFQTPRDVDNFTTTLAQVLNPDAPLLVNNQAVRLQDGDIYVGGRQLRVDAYPISIDFAKYNALGRNKEVHAKAQEIRDRVKNRKIVAGIERLDYTKGISERLSALELLLEKREFDPRENVMYLSFAVPREGVEAAQKYKAHLLDRIAKINKKYAVVDPKTGSRWQPIHDHWEDTPPELVPAVYLAADVMTITPLRDGMNLMAKEFVATRSDERGVLVLGEGAGAALEGVLKL
ncbi:MAG: trehalose-6-phosphate synthase, partial [Acidimicrobiales bacterium]